MISTINTNNKPPTCCVCPNYTQLRIASAGASTAAVLLVGDYPQTASPTLSKPFTDRAGRPIQMAIQQLRGMYFKTPGGPERWASLPLHETYAAQCTSEKEPPQAAVTACGVLLDTTIQQTRPKVIVSFGAMATKALLKHPVKFSAIRGTFINYVQRSSDPPHLCQLFVTYSPRAILGQPGLYQELIRDLRKAFLYAEGKRAAKQVLDVTALSQNYIFPHTVEEVRRVCEMIINYHHEGAPPEHHLIGVDTETTMLEMYDPTSKMIAISFSWEPGFATTIILDHPDVWWTPEELKIVFQCVREVVECPKPKVLHNDKFDRQVLTHRYGWRLRNVVWDTMCGEHLLEEDKKGEYGLKNLTKSRLPKYAGYDDKVNEAREKHGNVTRASSRKKYRKDLRSYQEALTIFSAKMDAHDREYVAYTAALDKWTEKRAAEKVNARAEKRRMAVKQNVGPKPRKPKPVKEPKEPVLQEPFDFTKIPIPELELYAAIDPDVTRQHLLHQNQRFDIEYKQDLAARKRSPVYYADVRPVRSLMPFHILPTSKTLAQMEYSGFPIDLEYLEEVDQLLGETITATQQKLYDLAGTFTIASSKDVATVLFSRGFHDEATGQRGVVPINDDTRRTNKGSIQTDEKALLYIAKTYAYEFPRVLLKYRKATKAKDAFLANIRDNSHIDGRMHASFHIPGTSTGRLSSSNENMQVIPKKLAGHNIKKIFVPPPGMVLVNTDARGAEVRIFSAYSMDEKLIAALNDGLDAHSFFTSKVFGVTYEDVQKARDMVDQWYAVAADASKPFGVDLFKWADALVAQRTNCKRVVFGTLYGAMAAKIADTAGISLTEAQNVINLMFHMFPSIPAYIRSTQNEVTFFKNVFTKTGRKRRFPMAHARTLVNRFNRQAVNFKIQATSSDIVLWVMNAIAPIITHDMRGELHATVHDSVVFSVPPEYLPQVKPMMYEYGTKRVAVQFPWLPVKFLWDVEAGPNYGQVTDIDRYLQGQHHATEIPEDEILSDEEVQTEFREDNT